MSVSSTSINISPTSQQGILEFFKQARKLSSQSWNVREQLERLDRLYMREDDFTKEHLRAKLANRYGDSSRFQNITVPVIKPAIEAAVNYQTSVFCSGEPMFRVVSPPEMVDQALSFNTLIENQSERGGWKSELIQFFRNGYKYNLCALDVDWESFVTYAIETDLGFSATQGKPKEVIWAGNTIKNLDLYNSFWDLRVKPTKIHEEGEFAGYTTLMSRIGFKKFLASLPDKIIANVIPALESGPQEGSINSYTSSYYIPELNPDVLVDQTNRAGVFDWDAWVGLTKGNKDGIKYKNVYEVTKLYARILPSDFNIKVPAASTPQVWKFYIVNGSVVIYAERLTNAHGWIPIIFGQPYEDGLGYQTKSMADDVAPIQSLSSSLTNSIVHGRRRAISDRTIYDPSRISEAHINSDNPSAKIPVKPSAYGKPVGESVYPFPYRDDQSGISLQQIPTLQQFAFDLTGQNKAFRGQFQKGNKTLHEYDDTMSRAGGNDQKVAIHLEDQVFQPVKSIIRLNILQFQGGTSLYSKSQQTQVQIDPVKLRQAVLDFDIVDGLTPVDKEISSDAWTTSMQVIGSSPQISAQYNLAPMFSYLMKTQGADLRPFEKKPEQVAYEQALQLWNQNTQLALEKGIQYNQPQPKPQDYGYNPQQQGAGTPAAPIPDVTQNINNITNNITNAE